LLAAIFRSASPFSALSEYNPAHLVCGRVLGGPGLVLRPLVALDANGFKMVNYRELPSAAPANPV